MESKPLKRLVFDAGPFILLRLFFCLRMRKVEASAVIRSANATLNVVNDEETTLKLGALKLKYEDKPWGDLSSAALALCPSESW